MLDVSVDMTVLSTSSRNRGIGRYVKSLCRALGARADWPGELGRAERGLTIAGLVRHHGKLLIRLVMAHDYLSPLPGARALQRVRYRARYGTALRVIASSKATKRDLIEQLALPPERIDVVHLGVDHERFVPRAEADERRRVRLLGYVESALEEMPA
jgi:glycosyltransferase involved in cell wall biosynthesis